MGKSKAPKKRIYSKPGQKDIELYPNQTAIVIHKTTDKYAEDGIPFCQFSINCWGYASRILKRKSSIQLYTYLSMNTDGFKKAFSSQDVCNFTGMGRRSFYEARDELEEEGFLHLSERSKHISNSYDCWEFYESPWDNPYWEYYNNETNDTE